MLVKTAQIHLKSADSEADLLLSEGRMKISDEFGLELREILGRPMFTEVKGIRKTFREFFNEVQRTRNNRIRKGNPGDFVRLIRDVYVRTSLSVTEAGLNGLGEVGPGRTHEVSDLLKNREIHVKDEPVTNRVPSITSITGVQLAKFEPRCGTKTGPIWSS